MGGLGTRLEWGSGNKARVGGLGTRIGLLGTRLPCTYSRVTVLYM